MGSKSSPVYYNLLVPHRRSTRFMYFGQQFTVMNKRLVLLCTILLSGLVIMANGPVMLQCEHMINPLGIDATQPRFAWQWTDTSKGSVQPACKILVATETASLQKGMGTEWQSDIPVQQQQITYAGKPLHAFTKYYWALQYTDGKGNTSLSSIASFETGIMDKSNWTGSWISDTKDINLKPAAYFRKIIGVGKKAVSARVYIACAGLYELTVNGKRIGDHRLDPMYTRFDRRTLYVSYDVTNELMQGNNCIGVLLGNGWYNHQSTAVWYFDKAPWRARPSFCLDLRIVYNDGSTETFGSGKDWKTFTSPIVFNSIYTAEHYDARLEIPHWNETTYNDSTWKAPVLMAAPADKIVAQVLQPIRITDTLQAVSIAKFSDTAAVYSFAKNMSGVTSLTVSGAAGTIVRVKHGERLYKNGRVDQSNIDVHYRPTDNTDPFQTDIYILKGGTETFMPRFNYKGFQYVEVSSNQPLQLKQEDLKAYFMHSDVPLVGNVSSSNATINKIWAAANQSYLSNLFGYPTDCPQREKNGWTGDAQINVETGLYNFDAFTVYEKWMADHRDEQQPNGVLPSIVPTGGWGYEWGNGPDWTSTIAVIPWNLYLFYGDAKPLQDCYNNIKRYVDHINQLYPTGLTTWGLGDWIPVKSKAPVQLTSTCYYYADVNILAKAAQLFHNDADYAYYTTLAEKIKKAFNDKYYHDGIYDSGIQTDLAVPLLWGLVPDDKKTIVAASLAKRVMADSVRLDVGLLGTKAILNALSENGYADLAYQLAAKETYPSWGWWIKNGATTLYENWPIDAGSDISLNHIMFGEISAWMYKALGGIKPDAASPGFKNVLVKPNFVKGLDNFSCSHSGPYGNIVSGWKRERNKVIYQLSIPANASATVDLPGMQTQQLAAGNYRFVVAVK
ncbi:MAG: family 78 glycoside hydrolase catalytic domain [Chitinophagaceae bacterium]